MVRHPRIGVGVSSCVDTFRIDDMGIAILMEREVDESWLLPFPLCSVWHPLEFCLDCKAFQHFVLFMSGLWGLKSNEEFRMSYGWKILRRSAGLISGGISGEAYSSPPPTPHPNYANDLEFASFPTKLAWKQLIVRNGLLYEPFWSVRALLGPLRAPKEICSDFHKRFKVRVFVPNRQVVPPARGAFRHSMG